MIKWNNHAGQKDAGGNSPARVKSFVVLHYHKGQDLGFSSHSEYRDTLSFIFLRENGLVTPLHDMQGIMGPPSAALPLL